MIASAKVLSKIKNKVKKVNIYFILNVYVYLFDLHKIFYSFKEIGKNKNPISRLKCICVSN